MKKITNVVKKGLLTLSVIAISISSFANPGAWCSFYVHTDHHFMQYIGNADTLLHGNDGGVDISNTNTNILNSKISGLAATQSYTLAVSDNSPNAFIIENQNNADHSRADASVYKSSYSAQAALDKAGKQFFIENKGQWDADVLYLARMGGLDAWITKYGVNYTFYKIEEISNASSIQKTAAPDKFEHKDYNTIGHRVLMELQNHNPNPSSQGKQKQEAYYNYFIGNDDSKHASNVALYQEATVKNVYNGIDLRYYFDKGSLRYDYIVNPGADPAQIAFTLKGSDKTYKNNKGNLVFTTRFGEAEMDGLYAYQAADKKAVSAEFKNNANNQWAFGIAPYDHSQPLIIDPLIYSTYISGTSDDLGISIALDASGNAYITGFTYSTDYDISAGAFQTLYGGGLSDVFVTKLNATGTALVYSTYIGGTSYDYGNSIALDASGNAYITGETYSTDYDISAGAFQTTNAGADDVFVTKLNPTGTALVYSTYIGGTDDDAGYSIALDASGNAYITGPTFSTDYDISAGAFQTTKAGADDVFVTKLNPTGSALVYSTYIGGTVDDVGYSIALDGSGNAYITGETYSTDYDISAGAFKTTKAGNNDVFVTKLNATGMALVYSTYIGGTSADWSNSIALDASGNAYITGPTFSTDYDISAGAFQTTNAGNTDVFVTKLNATGTALVYSTYIGGTDDDYGISIAVDASSNAYITGETYSTDYDISAGAFQTTKAGSEDVFVTKLNATGTALFCSTYIGGTDGDAGRSIAVDDSGNAYITGYTTSTDYDISAGAFQTTNDGSLDVFVTKLDMLCGALHIEPLYFKASFTVYPNPSNGSFYIQTDNAGTFEILDIAGKVLHTYIVKDTRAKKILFALPSGMYLIRERESGVVQKLVVE